MNGIGLTADSSPEQARTSSSQRPCSKGKAFEERIPIGKDAYGGREEKALLDSSSLCQLVFVLRKTQSKARPT